MRRWIGWVAFVLGLGACLALAYGAYQLAGYSWDQVVSYKTPYLGESVETSGPLLMGMQTPGKPAARRVVLVIVDGLRDDVSRSAMSNLQTLRQYGADFTLTVPQPSLSYPNWTTILTGAPQEISGVTTNWYDTKVEAPTLMDAARLAGKKVAVVGPSDFATLYATAPGADVVLRDWPKNGYLSKTLIDDALKLYATRKPDLLVIHLPDVDEAGHTYGGESDQYAAVANKVDEDLQRLLEGIPQGDGTTFLITADHGHIDTGGHGGWEAPATRVPFVLTGAPAVLRVGEGRLTQVAPTVSVLLGMPVPTFASDVALSDALSLPVSAYASDRAHHAAFAEHYVNRVVEGMLQPIQAPRVAGDPDAAIAKARAARVAEERGQRLPYAAMLALAALVAVALVFISSWRAGLAALVGVGVYYAFYNVLFFGLHGFAWSLSAFNTEDNVSAFMNGRLLEAAISGLVAVLAAAAFYPSLRKSPKGVRTRGYLGGWLALAPATVLTIQATLVLQIAWFLWAYGAAVTWALPDLKWGFKYDLDLVQVTALGAAALIAPLVTYLVGRYHPRVRRGGEQTKLSSGKT